jgi:NAD(P)-dependent dehydrogenase (short-subunit alcohol dehydrogenase family)
MATILITGANRGIGLEFVRQYADAGATVHACARKPAEATALAEIAANSNGRVQVHALDVADFDAIDALARTLRDVPIDLLINNAGIYGPPSQTATDFDADGWLTTFRVNTLAPMRMVQAFLPHLKAGDGKTVATITSQMGSITNNAGGYYAYRSAKAALNSAMRGLSVDLKGDDLFLVVMHPGWVKTDMGGAAAPLKPEDSVRDMRGVIARLDAGDNGRFFNHDGSELPW